MVAKDDRHHAAVTACLRGLAKDGIRLLVIEPVFSEAMTLVKRRLGSAVAIKMGESLRASRVAELASWSEPDREAAWTVFVRYADKDWSYVDCACLATMRSLDLTTAVSLDHHFEQMGVERLP